MTSLENIKILREKTGASLQACKKAIEEANGDETKAIEILRKKGEAKMADRADRMTSQGVVAVVMEGNAGLVLTLGCETDFVAKSPDFVKAAEALAREYLKNETYDANTMIQELNLKMGEKIEVVGKEKLQGQQLGAYTHSNQRIGALIALDGGDEAIAKDLAMHIAAMHPWATRPEDIDSGKIEKEREIWTEEIQKEGKPEAIRAKIMEGKERKFREEHALLTQAFVKNPDQQVKDLLKGVTVKGFARMEC